MNSVKPAAAMSTDRSSSRDLNLLLQNRDQGFWKSLERCTSSASTFNELIRLSRMRMRAKSSGLERPGHSGGKLLKVSIVGGSTLYPLSELIEHAIEMHVGSVEIKSGDFNNYRSEIYSSAGELYRFNPDFVILIPEERSCRYCGTINDSKNAVSIEIERNAQELLDLCSTIRDNCSAEVILCNFALPANHDLGPLMTKSPASAWNFRKSINYVLGTMSPNYVHICDIEFLAYRHGALRVTDDRSWFESKQAYSPSLQVEIAKEIGHLIASLRSAAKKVLVLDLDNTLWGGTVGDDGVDGIEIGDTSPRGEAFKAFQVYIRSLIDRGVLLGICSKNEFDNAVEPFRIHPEMILREDHFVSIKANWEPKAKNLIEMAEELKLGLDSFVFVDDNPAEIEIVKQFAPDVTTILLSDDPSTYVRQLQESRLFERSVVTDEDSERTKQYRQQAERRQFENSAVDMDSYLRSLGMVARISRFSRLDLPRIAQLINKSNQFNLTTRRRSEAEIESLMSDHNIVGLSVRLTDRFGDHGLISVVIARIQGGKILEIDTWLMSCRVLKREVEQVVLNELVRIAEHMSCGTIRGVYLPTAKNGMVRDLLPSLGFRTLKDDKSQVEFELSVDEFIPLKTHIEVESLSDHESNKPERSSSATAVHF